MQINWKIITTEHCKRSQAERFSTLILSELPNAQVSNLEKYHKFENSFCIEIEQQLGQQHFENGIAAAVIQAQKIAMPWNWLNLVALDSFEIIFNKDDHSIFKLEAFNPIMWMSLSLNNC